MNPTFDTNRFSSPKGYLGEISKFNKSEGRIIDCTPPETDEIVVTSCFVSKSDPQRGQTISPRQLLRHIREWSDSIRCLNLEGILFLDFIPDENTRKILDNQGVKVRTVILGEYSLNDERFLVYYTYLTQNRFRIKYFFMTDAFDVRILRSPFRLVDSTGHSYLYVGRDSHNLRIHSNWFIRKAYVFTAHFESILSPASYFEPLYNAGIIGGCTDVSWFLLNKLFHLFKRYPSSRNFNMLFLNVVISRYFGPKNALGAYGRRIVRRLGIRHLRFFVQLMSKLRMWYVQSTVDNKNDRIGNNAFIRTSFPLCNKFKSGIVEAGVVFKHK